MADSTVRMPTQMAAAGKKLWRSVAGTYSLRADELRVLEDACREADLVDTLEKAARGAQLLLTGSQGQPVINPLISELRQHRATLNTLLKALKLPDEADTAEARSTAARNAANARWGKRTG